MRGPSTLALTLAAATAVSGCAALRMGDGVAGEQVLSWRDVVQSRGAEIVAEQPAPAPAGLVAFCVRMPATCGAGGDDLVSYEPAVSDAELLRPAAWGANVVSSGAWSGVAEEDGAAVFSRLLALRIQGGTFHYEHLEVTLTEARWRELRTVNRGINREIVATPDASTYVLSEYWAMPISERMAKGDIARGDCEDFALEKRERLISLGWDRQALALAVAYSPATGLHAVLIAQTDHGDFVLDNLHDEPLAPQNLNYAWVSRQAGVAMTAWASARVEMTPPIWQQRPDFLQASRIGEESDRGSGAPAERLVQLAELEPMTGGPTAGFDGALAGVTRSISPFD